MEILRDPLPAGLYFVATPIGAARDITLKALDILASADVLAAEDTRTARHLMQIHGIALGDRPLIAYHDHSAPSVRDGLVGMAASGKSVACVSEAGTPMVSDPGFPLARAAIAAGVAVHAAPGPSAMLAALVVAGLPSDRVLFAGFPPAQAGARARMLEDLALVPATLVFYESPRRISRLLEEMVVSLGPDREAAVCRELTKRFEEISRGTLADLAQTFAEREVKGEIVLLVGRAAPRQAKAEDLEAALDEALARLSVKDAVAEVASALDLPRRQVYRAALAREGKA
ncbi:16S rRNA (cytidine(1402)-2'-O)-methyltransferase [Rhodovulum visakhapatnamense]|uniref:Ribosomal RNA small subunit methyltransferase I n=1 Tax=Rhodovulum visakhapatnamense TaxID=364297 RepID=A0A4R8FHL8_9RHOB|nr:16S rRNA (cytidine(1402)-2'-O)-methyltransferase [Rhodovulum visakhapatnamense]TDX25509.1 16S rRNA (cytidine1402-2'-O)-methyltransferase [Rhodovulum visakhapatnamense]